MSALSRSAHMRRVRSEHTEPEMLLRSLLWKRGLRYRLYLRIDGMRPDLVFKRHKVAVFVDGCFWHGCPDHYAAPRSRGEFWAKKLRDNVMRDAKQTQVLTSKGWRVLRYFAHQVWSHPEAIADDVEEVVHGAKPSQRSMYWRVLFANPTSGNLEEQQLLCLDTAALSVRLVPRRSNTMTGRGRRIAAVKSSAPIP
jgi:DNA mismatch endonuclease (patch repair protein)